MATRFCRCSVVKMWNNVCRLCGYDHQLPDMTTNQYTDSFNRSGWLTLYILYYIQLYSTALRVCSVDVNNLKRKPRLFLHYKTEERICECTICFIVLMRPPWFNWAHDFVSRKITLILNETLTYCQLIHTLRNFAIMF